MKSIKIETARTEEPSTRNLTRAAPVVRNFKISLFLSRLIVSSCFHPVSCLLSYCLMMISSWLTKTTIVAVNSFEERDPSEKAEKKVLCRILFFPFGYLSLCWHVMFLIWYSWNPFLPLISFIFNLDLNLNVNSLFIYGNACLFI